MALDEAAARALSDEHSPAATLRFYGWARPTLSFGRNEPARDRFDPHRLADAGVDVVRRPTGGRAVLHDRELTYSVVVPLRGGLRGPGGPRALYQRVHRALAAGLVGLGVPAAVAGESAEPEPPDSGIPGKVGAAGGRTPVTAAPGRVLRPDAGPCFDLPAPGEVVAEGRKLVGSAQVRIGGALLQHGSILLHDDQGRIAELAEAGVALPRPGARPGTLGELLARVPTRRELADALTGAFEMEFGGEFTSLSLAPERSSEFPDPDALLARHRDPDWIWRR